MFLSALVSSTLDWRLGVVCIWHMTANVINKSFSLFFFAIEISHFFSISAKWKSAEWHVRNDHVATQCRHERNNFRFMCDVVDRLSTSTTKWNPINRQRGRVSHLSCFLAKIFVARNLHVQLRVHNGTIGDIGRRRQRVRLMCLELIMMCVRLGTGRQVVSPYSIPCHRKSNEDDSNEYGHGKYAAIKRIMRLCLMRELSWTRLCFFIVSFIYSLISHNADDDKWVQCNRQRYIRNDDTFIWMRKWGLKSQLVNAFICKFNFSFRSFVQQNVARISMWMNSFFFLFFFLWIRKRTTERKTTDPQ